MFLIYYLLLLNQTFKDIREVVMECNHEVTPWTVAQVIAIFRMWQLSRNLLSRQRRRLLHLLIFAQDCFLWASIKFLLQSFRNAFERRIWISPVSCNACETVKPCKWSPDPANDHANNHGIANNYWTANDHGSANDPIKIGMAWIF